MRALNLFIREVLLEGEGDAPQSFPIESDVAEYVEDVESVPSSNPVVIGMVERSNKFLNQNLDKILNDVEKELSLQQEVGTWQSGTGTAADDVIYAKSVERLLRLDAADLTQPYPYRTGLYVVAYRTGITAPYDTITQAMNNTEAAWRAASSWIPFEWSGTYQKPSEESIPEDSPWSWADLGLPSAALAAVGLGTVGFKYFKKRGAQAIAGAATDAAQRVARVPGGSALDSMTRGALMDALSNRSATDSIIDATMDGTVPQSAYEGLKGRISDVLAGFSTVNSAAAWIRLQRVLRGLPATLKLVGGKEISAELFFGILRDSDKLRALLKKIIPELIDDVIKDTAEITDDVLKKLFDDLGTIKNAIQSFDNLTEEEQIAIEVLDALLSPHVQVRLNQLLGSAATPGTASLAALDRLAAAAGGPAGAKVEMTALSAIADRFGSPTRAAVNTLVKTSCDAIHTLTGLGRAAGGLRKGALAAAKYTLYGLGAVGALITGNQILNLVRDAYELDAYSFEQVSQDELKDIATDVKIRHAAEECAEYLIDEAPMGGVGTKGDPELMLYVPATELLELLGTPLSEQIESEDMEKVADKFKDALKNAGYYEDTTAGDK